jgi:hypothetical protein
MRVPLDECVPRQLRRDLEGVDVKTVQKMGWTGVHIHLRARVALVILAANTTDPLKRRPLMPRVRAALQGRAPGRVVRVAA